MREGPYSTAGSGGRGGGGKGGGGERGRRQREWGVDSEGQEAPETLYHRDDALLYIAYVMLIWGAPIPADRWRCSLWP